VAEERTGKGGKKRYTRDVKEAIVEVAKRTTTALPGTGTLFGTLFCCLRLLASGAIGWLAGFSLS